MPVAALQNIADKSGKDMKTLEKYWDEAKKSADEKGLDPETDNYWAYVMAIVLRRAGLKENVQELVDDVLLCLEKKKELEFVPVEEDALSKYCRENNYKKELVKRYWEAAKKAVLENDKISSEDFSKRSMEVFLDIIKGKDLKIKEFESMSEALGNVISKEEIKNLKKAGIEVNKVPKKDLEKIIADIRKKHKKKSNKFNLLTNITGGILGGFAAGKALDKVFSLFKPT